jgi:hypothetical protein
LPQGHRTALRRCWKRQLSVRFDKRIEAALSGHAGRFVIVPVPNMTHVFYGRDVGYVVERIVLDDNIEAITATHLRRLGTER